MTTSIRSSEQQPAASHDADRWWKELTLQADDGGAALLAVAIGRDVRAIGALEGDLLRPGGSNDGAVVVARHLEIVLRECSAAKLLTEGAAALL